MKKCIVDHLGNVYPTIKEMCRHYRIKTDTYSSRIKKGWTLEDALTIGDTHKKKCVDYLGNEYNTIGEMCEAYHITRAKYGHRIKAGWSLEDALTKPDSVGIPSKDHTGKVYDSISDMCKAWGITIAKYNHRIDMGFSIEEALTTPDLSNSKKCEDHLGNKYISITDMCRKWKVDRTTFKDRMERGWTLEEALTNSKRRIIPKSKSCKDHLGREYDSIAEMCRCYRIDYTVFNRRRSLGWNLEEALTEKDDPIKPNSKACVDHLGNEFNSIVEMCRFWNITPDLHKGRLKDGWTLEETLTIPRKYSLGEYRVSVILNEYKDSQYMDYYFHDITIKKAFSYLGLDSLYKEFLDEYGKRLTHNDISVSKQRIAKFRFDFSLIKNGSVFAFIEFDGEQHFKFVDLFFKTIDAFLIKHYDDLAKSSFSEVSRIPLLRIRYDQIENEKIRYMISDLLTNPNRYLERHNTFLSNEDYMSVFEKNTKDIFSNKNLAYT